MVVTITSSDCPFVIWVEVQWMQCCQCSGTCTYFINAFFNSAYTIINICNLVSYVRRYTFVNLILQFICYGVQLATIYSVCRCSGNFTCCNIFKLTFSTSFTYGYRTISCRTYTRKTTECMARNCSASLSCSFACSGFLTQRDRVQVCCTCMIANSYGVVTGSKRICT